jgi:hypothetical protein
MSLTLKIIAGTSKDNDLIKLSDGHPIISCCEGD